jgi:hypothetical protein
MPDDLQDALLAQDRFADSILEPLLKKVNQQFSKAAQRTISRLQAKLDLAGNQILGTRNNQRVLRQVQQIFMEELTLTGYPQTIEAFTGTFPRQLPFFTDTLEALNETLKTPLPMVQFTKADIGFFISRQISAAKLLDNLPFRIAGVAMERTLLATGGLPLKNLIGTLSETFAKAPLQVESLAITSIETHYRVIQDRGYQLIEEERGPLKFRYYGPRDKLNRPFCRSILAENAPRTRAQINKLDNRSSLKPVFTAAGGWNCRHQWIPTEEEKQTV